MSFSLFLAQTTSIAIFLILTQFSTVQSNPQTISQTCKQTPYYNLCLNHLTADPRSSTADVKGLALIMVDLLKGKTTRSAQFIKQITGKRPELQKLLKECARKYDVILTANIPVAIEALEKGDPKFAEGGMNDAAIEVNSCESSFRGTKSPLSSYNKLLHDTSLVASAIARQLL
ncbi:cell wall / vacuolar inhibitor of fructosidase 1-like [Euphorbia lathyris]|uniref:cell wall / vacuolar inhibitor of fructosidase 1-like n=1 Tax=Euphorbia lathyris TaxID=212925 RepID=UPI0033131ECF